MSSATEPIRPEERTSDEELAIVLERRKKLDKGVVLLSPGKRMTLRLLENIERLQKFSPCCADFLSEEL
jgi:hypothetical protein